MNLRACSLAFLLALAPSALAGVDAAAQGAPQNDPFTDMARQRFQEGVKLYDAKKYEESRGAFMQAYALKKHPAVLLNLAQSELKSGHPVEAARHFSQYLSENKEASAAERKTAEQGLSEARLKTGRVLIEVNVQGADVFVDEELVGRSPLREAVDVGPGNHKVEARFAGYPNASAQVAAAIGQQSSISLKLDKGGSSAAVAPPVAAPPATAAPVSTTPEPGPAPTETTPPGPGPSGDTGLSLSTEGRPSFFQWVRDDKLAWVAGGVTLLGIGLAAGYGLAANSASSNADSIAGQIKARAGGDPDLLTYGNPPVNRQSNPCATPIAITKTDYNDACGQLRENLDDRDSHKKMVWVGVGTAAVGVAGAAVLYFVRTRPQKTQTATIVTPIISPTMSGLSVGGVF